jgi:hypothetical protein
MRMRKSRFFGGVAHAHAHREVVSLKTSKESFIHVYQLQELTIFFFNQKPGILSN